MKKLGRRHRPFFRVCAVDGRGSRDGKVIEYLGHYDPLVKETDARAVLNGSRIDYWLSVGAQPSDKVAVLIKKYGTSGTHLDQQRAALERLRNSRPTAPPPVPIPKRSAAESEAAEQQGEVAVEAAVGDAQEAGTGGE
jgi:small subunit ribosomal protein S16